MTGRPGQRTMEMNEDSSASYLARTPCVPLFYILSLLLTTSGNRKASSLPGEGEDHFHCTVEPSSGHLRVNLLPCEVDFSDSRAFI